MPGKLDTYTEQKKMSRSLTYTEKDKLITANIQLCKLCLLPLLAVAFLKALQTGGNKSDNDQRGIPPPRSRVEVASNREVKKLLFHPQRQM